MNAFRPASAHERPVRLVERPVVEKPDQEVGAQPTPSHPTNVTSMFVAEDERQHHRHEEVHVDEEAGEPVLVLHVPVASDVDQERDTR